MSFGTPADIIVVEDNEIQRASIVASILNVVDDLNIVQAAGSEEAMTLLLDGGADFPPSLILLDLTLLGGKAFELLAEIRASEIGIAHTPVVIFSDSQSSEDIEECYRRGASSYIVKPLNYAEFQRAVEDIARYWLLRNQAPT